jgi:hypothetical protein
MALGSEVAGPVAVVGEVDRHVHPDDVGWAHRLARRFDHLGDVRAEDTPYLPTRR